MGFSFLMHIFAKAFVVGFWDLGTARGIARAAGSALMMFGLASFDPQLLTVWAASIGGFIIYMLPIYIKVRKGMRDERRADIKLENTSFKARYENEKSEHLHTMKLLENERVSNDRLRKTVDDLWRDNDRLRKRYESGDEHDTYRPEPGAGAGDGGTPLPDRPRRKSRPSDNG